MITGADSAGNVRFNWRVIQAPMRLVDYVVAHELVHLRHPEHNRDFWAVLGSVMSDYEERRERLRPARAGDEPRPPGPARGTDASRGDGARRQRGEPARPAPPPTCPGSRSVPPRTSGRRR